MKFIVDDQLPVALARAIADAGHVACHVLDEELSGRDDGAIWRHACAHDFVIVTKDEDFVRLQAARPPRAPVLWLRVGNTRKKALLTHLMPQLPHIVLRFERGEIVVEVC